MSVPVQGWRVLTHALMWTATGVGLCAQTFTTLHSFNATDGSNPNGGLVQGVDGNFYGTTSTGGTGGGGTVFRITPAGDLTTIYNFCSLGGCADGSGPQDSLVQATNGYLYGTTFQGGAYGNGTVFKVSLSGSLTTLVTFDLANGDRPAGGLIQSLNGDFYGTTQNGGEYYVGTFFKMTPTGSLTTLHTFTQDANGYEPEGGVVLGPDGDFYGTTLQGGIGTYCGNPCGTAFKITPAGTLTSLHDFDGPDGTFPYAGLALAADGELYGATSGGGGDGVGTIYKIAAGGAVTTLYSFFAAGSDPQRAMTAGSDGSLYGVTLYSGYLETGGTIYKITDDALTTLYTFCLASGCPDGSNPQEVLLQATNSNMYGTTSSGGTGTACAGGCGTVFVLNERLPPFVKALPTMGRVGGTVQILGTNLTGATSVTFNGTPATFTVDSHSLIRTTVPTGATSGVIQVNTPSRTLSSNVNFQVTP